MNEQQREFIEKMGISFERSGAAPMLGRVWGALLMTDAGYLSAEELAQTLSASRGAISQATRQLTDLLYIEKFRKPGDRKDYFRVLPQGLVDASRKRLEELRRMRKLFVEGLEAMEGASQASTRLRENIEFFNVWEETLQQFFDEWLQHKGDPRAKRNSDN